MKTNLETCHHQAYIVAKTKFERVVYVYGPEASSWNDVEGFLGIRAPKMCNTYVEHITALGHARVPCTPNSDRIGDQKH